MSVTVALLYRHTARLDRRRPFLDLAADEALEVGRIGAIGAHQVGTNCLPARLQRRHIHSLDGGVVKLADDRLWCLAREEQPDPIVGLESGKPLVLRSR